MQTVAAFSSWWVPPLRIWVEWIECWLNADDLRRKIPVARGPRNLRERGIANRCVRNVQQGRQQGTDVTDVTRVKLVLFVKLPSYSYEFSLSSVE